MVTPGISSNSQQAGKKDRREAAREKARIDREHERRRNRRNKFFIHGGIGAVIIAALVIIALVIFNPAPPPSTAAPKNMASNGILLAGKNMEAVPTPAANKSGVPIATDKTKHAATTNIVIYIDFQCPVCLDFEKTNASAIESLVKAEKATIEIHPIAILERMSGTNRYSTRAANAAACVANYEPNKFFAVTAELFASQPAENAEGKTNREILTTLKDAGAESDEIRDCVKTETFSQWVGKVTTNIKPDGQTKTFAGVANELTPFRGTPSIFVNGSPYAGSYTDATAFATFVQSVATPAK